MRGLIALRKQFVQNLSKTRCPVSRQLLECARVLASLCALRLLFANINDLHCDNLLHDQVFLNSLLQRSLPVRQALVTLSRED